MTSQKKRPVNIFTPQAVFDHVLGRDVVKKLMQVIPKSTISSKAFNVCGVATTV